MPNLSGSCLIWADLTGDKSLKERKGVAALTAKHLFAMASIKGVGWGLLRWYAGVMAERHQHGE